MKIVKKRCFNVICALCVMVVCAVVFVACGVNEGHGGEGNANGSTEPVNRQVTEEQWNAALSLDAFKNVTMETLFKYGKTTMKFDYENGLILMDDTYNFDGNITYSQTLYVREGDDNIHIYYREEEQAWQDNGIRDYSTIEMLNKFSGYYLGTLIGKANSTLYYNDFTYDEQVEGYVCERDGRKDTYVFNNGVLESTEWVIFSTLHSEGGILHNKYYYDPTVIDIDVSGAEKA